MTNVVEFNFEDNAVRTVEREDGVWFVAKDVSDVLGFRMASDMTRMLDDDEKSTRNVRIRSGSGVEQDRSVNTINESGLYAAILKSRKPEAKQFKKWVTSVVLPSIRKNGGYIQGQETAQSPEEVIANALIVAQRVIDNMKPKALYHDEWMSADGSYTITEVAKKLGITAQKLNKFLREQQVKCKNSDMPRAGYESWFEIVDYAIEKAESKSIKSHVRVNGEGVKNIIQMYGETA